MLKLSFSMLSVLTLICIQVCVQAVWANRCQGVFTNTSSWIDAKVNAIHSSESLAQFLSETGGFGPANYEHIQKLATILYGEVDVQRLANALLLNHRHTAKDAVLLASFAVYRGDLTNAKQLMRYFPKSVDKETFFRWTNAKTTLQSEFMQKLQIAIEDYKEFKYVYGEYIDSQKAINELAVSFENLNDPSLVGHFMEVFLAVDRLTRQYIIEELAQLRKFDEKTLTVTLRGLDEDQTRHATEKAIEKILNVNLDRHQETAYFEYRSNRISNRPLLPDAKISMKVAKRYIKRMNFDLIESDVRYASEVLAAYPKPDESVDKVLVEVLNSATKLSKSRLVNWDIAYALFELTILERNAKGLSNIKLDFAYSAGILATETKHKRSYRLIGHLASFHEKYDLQQFPQLMKLLNEFRKKYPDMVPESIPKPDPS